MVVRERDRRRLRGEDRGGLPPQLLERRPEALVVERVLDGEVVRSVVVEHRVLVDLEREQQAEPHLDERAAETDTNYRRSTSAGSARTAGN